MRTARFALSAAVTSTLVGAMAPALLATGCGERPEIYDAPVVRVAALALTNRVALVDDGAHRVVMLVPRAGQELDRISVPVGKGVVRAEVASDGKHLLVLSAGDVPRRKPEDEGPSLTIVDEALVAKRIPLESPRSGLAIDPLGRYAALFKAPSASAPSTGALGNTGPVVLSQAGFVENPNQIEIVDLAAPPESAVTSRTLRSFGGSPQRVTFTPELTLPGGKRRLLVVETQQDLSVLDLDNVRQKPERSEITVPFTTGATTAVLTPAGIVVDDGDPAKNDDARIAVKFTNSPSVLVLTLVPPSPTAEAQPGTTLNDFTTSPNLTDVGGPASDIAFVRTEAGLRLAAVVPTAASAVLVDPATSTSQVVVMPAGYARISLVSDVLGGGPTDTAILYGASGNAGIAFWSLARAIGQPYRSIEAVTVPAPIAEVIDVPPPRQQLKVLKAANALQFFVLNLASRTAAPLTTTGAPTLHVAPDGQRLWAFERSTRNLSLVSLEDLHPTSLPLDRGIGAVFDVQADGGRALVAIDPRGGVGATVLDALAPDTATSRSYYGLLLEDVR